MIKIRLRVPFLVLAVILFCSSSQAQRYLSDIDSSFLKDTVRPLIKRFENINISGYMQPQFQVAEARWSAIL